MSLSEVLVWLSGVGSIAAVSWVIEYFDLFKTMDAKVKQLVFFGICAVLGIAAQLINTFVPVAVLTAIAPYFATLFVIFANLFLGTAFHKVTKIPTVEAPKEVIVVKDETGAK